MRALFILTPLFVFLGATYASSSLQSAPAPRVTTVKATLYGEALGPQPARPLHKVLGAPKSYEGKTVTVTGYVRKACTKKGCWMELAPTSDKKVQGCRVTFKNYGFFVPLDSAGATARLQGSVQLKKLTKEAVDHYEAEGATFTKKQPDGSAHEMRIIATGVELTK